MSDSLWINALAVSAGLALWAGLCAALAPKFLSSRLLQKSDRLANAYHLLQKLSWRNFFESNLRAQTGKPLDRPYGVKRGIIPFEPLQFNPVCLTRPSLESDAAIDTEVILGPRAQKPLRLKIPILIGGMAYGSGYSEQAKIALAKAATLAGTAADSGNGPFVAAERAYAEKFILQYPRGFWSKEEAVLKQADLIEIALGHSARGSAPVRIAGKKLTLEVAARYGALPHLDVLMESTMPGVKTMPQWQALIRELKEVTGGVPVGFKFGASHYLEQELALFVEAGADLLAFDGTEGGTHGGMPTFMDDMGLPVVPALCRAVRFLETNGLCGQISLAVGGGLVTPGEFAKCLALGADAVIIGTITALAMSHTQTAKAVPWEPPTGLLYNDAKEKNKYDPDVGAQHLAHYMQSCVEEMKALARTLGKHSLRELDRSDLMALEPLLAEITGIDYLLKR
jgi:glutamate synthase domain-containing protein 2